MRRNLIAGAVVVGVVGLWLLRTGGGDASDAGGQQRASAGAARGSATDRGSDLYASRRTEESATRAEDLRPSSAPALTGGREATRPGEEIAPSDPSDGSERGRQQRVTTFGRSNAPTSPEVQGEETLRELDDEPPDEVVEEEPEEAAEPEILADLEAQAADLAEDLELLESGELESRVERAMRKDPTLSPEDARRQVLADAAIVEDLARSRYPDGAPESVLNTARGMAYTLLSSQTLEYRAGRLVGLVQRLTGG